MIYHTLTADDQMRILHERVRELEADHCRTRLLLAEVEHDPARAAKHQSTLAEIERRIARHVGEPDEPDSSTGERTDGDDGGTDGVSDDDPGKIEPSQEMLTAAGSNDTVAPNGAVVSLER